MKEPQLIKGNQALAEAVVRQADLRPDPANEPPGVNQAWATLWETKSKSERYRLYWRWGRVERELGDE